MNENNYNVCSRCGSANPLSARYCYQCGFELKSPEAPVVCTKCNTVNPGSANYCKRCGSKLPKAQSKVLCPHCSASNNAESTFCVNCGYDFTTHMLPSSVAVQQQIEQQQQQLQVAATEVVVTTQQSVKLSRRDRARLKREEEERAYREEIEAKKAAKQQKKELKKINNQNVPAVQSFAPETDELLVVEKPRKKRFKNFIVFLLAFLGLYFLLLPQQINFLKISFPLATVTIDGVGVSLTGWDVVIACLSNFISGAASLSQVVAENAGGFNSLMIVLAGATIAIIALALLNYFFAKFVGICSGKPHNGVDAFAICATILTLGGAVCMFISKEFGVQWHWQLFVVPLTFLLIALFNSNKRIN